MTNNNDWIVELGALHAELLDRLEPIIQGINYSKNRGTGGIESVEETTAVRREALENDWEQIKEIAAELGWRGQADRNPDTYIYGRQEWASANYPDWNQKLTILQAIHARWEDLLNLEPISDYTCPACLEARLRHHRNGGLACRSCEWYGTAEDYRNMLTFRISTSEARITREQARSLYPELKTVTLRKWIERGKLVETSEGIPIKELDTLMSRLIN